MTHPPPSHAATTRSLIGPQMTVLLTALTAVMVVSAPGCEQRVAPSENTPKAENTGSAPAASADRGAESDANPNEGNQPVQTYTISKHIGGVETQLATLEFGGAKAPELTIEADGPEAEQLKKDWAEVVEKGKITLEEREETEVDGDLVTEMNAVLVGPEEERYPDAVWSYLESNYGYIVDLDY